MEYVPITDVNRMLERIKQNRFNKEYRYIIMGRQGPTGKSWLTGQLIDLQLDATEISEELAIMGAISEWSNCNYFFIDHYRKLVIIVLNEILPMYRCKATQE